MAAQGEALMTSIDELTGEVRFHVGNYAYPVDFSELTYPDIYPCVERPLCNMPECDDASSSTCVLYNTQNILDTHYRDMYDNNREEITAYRTQLIHENNKILTRNMQSELCQSGETTDSEQNECSCLGNTPCNMHEEETEHYDLKRMKDSFFTFTSASVYNHDHVQYISKNVNNVSPIATKRSEHTPPNVRDQSNNESTTCPYNTPVSECETMLTWPSDQSCFAGNDSTDSIEETNCKKSLVNMDTQTFVCHTDNHREHNNSSCYYNNYNTGMTSCWYKTQNSQTDFSPCSRPRALPLDSENASRDIPNKHYKTELNSMLRFPKHTSSDSVEETMPVCNLDSDLKSTNPLDSLSYWSLHNPDSQCFKNVHSSIKKEPVNDFVYDSHSNGFGNDDFMDDLFLTTQEQTHVGKGNEVPAIVHQNKNIRSRGQSTGSSRKLKRGCRLWEFIRNLLLDPNTNPALIRWENRSVGTFKLVQSKQIAYIWGMKKGNEGMNYEKLSRAMRYYYKRNIFAPVLGKRLVYMFGPRATGWRAEEIS